MPASKKAPNESGLSQHIASATAKHYLDFALEVDFFCATEVLFFCEERFWATCFFEEGFLLLATEVLLAAFFEATVVRFLLETALCFELDRLDESVCLPFFCDLDRGINLYLHRYGIIVVHILIDGSYLGRKPGRLPVCKR